MLISSLLCQLHDNCELENIVPATKFIDKTEIDKTEAAHRIDAAHGDRVEVGRTYARSSVFEYLAETLRALHGDFTGGPVDYQWQKYFGLARVYRPHPSRLRREHRACLAGILRP
ncbi:hypothetical protein ACIP5Y_23390 [Nocardia sp. NPDC088792]|uniref:hypothetical protein n=1 Tax=Nocardia sp. NPDC088792 TaxID=3364332 RepID=UPI0038262538